MPQRTVWVDDWQMQCCGEPFSIDSTVQWTTVRVDDPTGYTDLLDSDLT